MYINQKKIYFLKENLIEKLAAQCIEKEENGWCVIHHMHGAQ